MRFSESQSALPGPSCREREKARRQLAWDNAQRLLAAPTAKEREVIAKEIGKHARDNAREILPWYR